MPWCEACSRYFNPSSLRADGTCPACGRQVVELAGFDEPAEVKDSRAPWHFWLLLAAVVLYLGWRLLQGIAWLLERL